jgi:uncharacterized membrane protein YfcA
MQFVLNAFIVYGFCVVGIYIFYWFTVKSLKEGKVRTRYGETYRQTNPISFWLGVATGIIIGLLALGGAILVIFHPIKI